MSRPLLLATLLTACSCAIGVGCAGTYRTRILLPLEGNPDRLAGEQCDRECRIGHHEGDYEYLRCLVTCPGVEVARDMACSEDDLPPRAICRVTDLNLENRYGVSSSGDSAGGAFLGSLIGAIAVGALTSATRSKSSSSSDESEASSAPSKSGGSVPLPQRPASNSSSSKSDSHKKAEPKKGK